jgi:hypothetical protein
MNSLPFNPNPVELEALFESERRISLEPDELRLRVVTRARASLPRNLRLQPVAHTTGPRRLRWRELAISAFLLSGVCAAAFYAGYVSKSGHVEARAATQVTASFAPVPSVIGAPSAMPPVMDAETLHADAPHEKSKSVLFAKPTTAIEAYILEVRVLQPARQAVAEQKYVSALRAVAEHQRRFAAGKLAEEREALRIRALLGLGRIPEAQRAGAAFRSHFPNSALLERIDEMLGTRG